MLKEYLIVAQEALNAKKEIYQIKQQRFELAQEEYQQLHKMCEDDSRSYTSCELSIPLQEHVGRPEPGLCRPQSLQTPGANQARQLSKVSDRLLLGSQPPMPTSDGHSLPLHQQVFIRCPLNMVELR